MKHTGLLLFTLTALAGCAVTPPIPTFDMPIGTKIGILVDVGEVHTHEHVGTTIFNNFTKSYPYVWNLDQTATTELSNRLQQSGFDVVDLEPLDISFQDIGGLIVADGQSWTHNPAQSNQVARLRDEFGLRAVVLVKEHQVLAAMECAGGPCTNRYIDSSGLYTRSIFGITNYTAVAALGITIYLLDPPAILPLEEKFLAHAIPIRQFPKAADFKNLTAEEFEPVRLAIQGYITDASNRVAATLQGEHKAHYGQATN